jgi:hypothetical protein
MNTALGCLIVGIGLYATLFTDKWVRFSQRRTRQQWLKNLMASDLYSLSQWLGGIGFIFGGSLMIYFGVAGH